MNISLKILCCFPLVFCSIFSLRSQDYDYNSLFEKPEPSNKKERNSSERKSYILFNINAAIPVGEYGSSNPFDKNPGFAKTLIDANLSAGFPIYHFLFSYSSFGYIKNKAQVEELRNIYAPLFGSNGIDLLDLKYNGYNHIYLVSGFALSGTVDFISIDLRAQLGFSTGIDSELDMLLSDGLITIHAVSEKALAFSFMPSVGTSIKIKLKENLLFAVNFDYRHAKYKFKDVKTTIGNFSTLDDYEIKTDVISIGAGIGLLF